MDQFGFILKLIERVSGPSKKATRAMKQVERQMKAVDKTAKMVGRSQGIVANSMKKVTLNASKMGRAIKQASEVQRKAAKQARHDARMGRAKGAFDTASKLSMASSAATSTGRSMLGGLAAVAIPAVQLEQSMSRVRSLTTYTGDATAAFKAQQAAVERLGASTVFTARETAGAMAELAVAGFDAKSQMAALPAVLDLAVASQMDIASTAKVATNIMSGFGIQAKDLRGASDILTAAFTSSNTTLEGLAATMTYVAPIAKAVGMDLSGAAKMSAVLGNAGIDASMAGTSLRKMLSSLSAPTTQASKALRKMGIATKDSAGNLISPLETLLKLNEAMKGMGSADRVGVAKVVFSERASTAAIELLDKLGKSPAGVAGYKEIAAAIDAAAGSTSRIAAIQMDTAWGSYKSLTSALEGASIQIGTALLPAIKELVPELIVMAKEFGAWAKANPGTIAGIAKAVAVFGALAVTIGAVASTAATALLGWGAGMWAIAQTSVLLGGLKTGIVLLAKGALWLIVAFGGIPVAIGAAIVGAGVAMYAYWDEIMSYFSGLVIDMKYIGNNMGEALMSGISGAFGWIQDMLAKVGIGNGSAVNLSAGAVSAAAPSAPSAHRRSTNTPRIAPGSLVRAIEGRGEGAKKQGTLRQNVELNLTISGADTSDAQSIARVVNEQMSSMLRSEHAMAGG